MKWQSIVCWSSLTVLAMSAGLCFAAPTAPNEVGLYLEPNGYGDTGTSVTGSPVTVYLVLTKPQGEELGWIPFTYAQSYECYMFFDPVPTGVLFLLYATFPPGAINIGQSIDNNNGHYDLVVGVPYAHPVVDEAIVLASFEFLMTADNSIGVFLRPSEGGTTIEGEMCYLGGNELDEMDSVWELQRMRPVSGSFDDPVFIFNGMAVQTEVMTFGQVKALYR